ncbi:MAG: C1 family peptidase [Proteobacteria bacterium]|nr:C1 family peptidase [Pseudomonadota bacterium]
MFGIKKNLTILVLITFASLENSHAMEIMEEVFGSDPHSYDMRNIMGSLKKANAIFPVYNQGKLGSCSANAGAGAMQFCQIRDAIKVGMSPEKATTFVPSRLFIYWFERYNDSARNTNKDTGASVQDCIFTLATNGVCDEKLWDYNQSFRNQPSNKAIAAAKRNVCMDVTPNVQVPASETAIVSSVASAQITAIGDDLLKAIKFALSNNYPVLFAIDIYSSFKLPETDLTGFIPIPQTKEKFLHNHIMMFVGYDNNLTHTYDNLTHIHTRTQAKEKVTYTLTGFFTVRNSWGTHCGDNGYYYLPYEIIINKYKNDLRFINDPNLAGDFYVLSKIGSKV